MPSKPLVDLVGVEANEVADLVVRDGALGDHAPDVPNAGRDVAGAAGRVEQLAAVVSVVAGWLGTHVCLPWSKFRHDIHVRSRAEKRDEFPQVPQAFSRPFGDIEC
jgi:hypothetical protein